MEETISERVHKRRRLQNHAIINDNDTDTDTNDAPSHFEQDAVKQRDNNVSESFRKKWSVVDVGQSKIILKRKYADSDDELSGLGESGSGDPAYAVDDNDRDSDYDEDAEEDADEDKDDSDDEENVDESDDDEDDDVEDIDIDDEDTDSDDETVSAEVAENLKKTVRDIATKYKGMEMVNSVINSHDASTDDLMFKPIQSQDKNDSQLVDVSLFRGTNDLSENDLFDLFEKRAIMHKKICMKYWLAGVEDTPENNKHMSDIYDTVYRTPSFRDIFMLRVPQKEKQVLFEKLTAIHMVVRGTQYYFRMLNDINTEYTSLASQQRTHEELVILNAQIAKHGINVQKQPLLYRIMDAGFSEHNLAIVLGRYNTLSKMSPTDENHVKLREWVELALKIPNKQHIPVALSDPNYSITKYLASVKQHMDKDIYGMVKAKESLLELTYHRMTNQAMKNQGVAFIGPPGVGKCLAPDTPVLMFTGGICLAKNVNVGDLLMGDDSLPREVLSMCRGTDIMYRVTPQFGEPFIVNEPHILSLISKSSGEKVDIPLHLYLKKPLAWRQEFVGYQVAIDYPDTPITNDPYIVGLVIGGTHDSIKEVMRDYLQKKLDNIYSFVNGVQDVKKIFVGDVEEHMLASVMMDKQIPEEYLYGNKCNRIKLLRGILDAAKLSADKEILSRHRSRSMERPPSGAAAAALAASAKSKRSKTPIAVRQHDVPKAAFVTGAAVASPARVARSRIPVRTASPTRVSMSASRVSSAASSSYSSRIITPMTSASVASRSASPTRMTQSVTVSASRSPPRSASPTRSSSPSRLASTSASATSASSASASSLLALMVPQQINYNYSIKIYNEKLANDIVFLARSIGLIAKCEQGNSNTICYIAGDLDKPCDIIHNTLKVEKLVRGPYVGWELGGNHRFVLQNMMVTHNTQLVQSWSKATDTPFAKQNVGGANDASFFTGHDFIYIGSQPGCIYRQLANLKCTNGIIYFDEFDKISNQHNWGGNVSHAFLHITDPAQQHEFQDTYFGEIKIDLSNLTFVYSMNDRKNMDPTLLNRLRLIDVEGYKSHEKKIIINNYLLPQALKEYLLQENDIKLTDEAISKIIDMTYNEDNHGVRLIRQAVFEIVSKCSILNKCCQEGLMSYFIKDFKLPFVIDYPHIDMLKIEFKDMMSAMKLMYI